MVDYDLESNEKPGTIRSEFNEEIQSPGIWGEDDDHEPHGSSNQMSANVQNKEDNIHMDSIGEYKSEYIKVSFESTSTEVKHNINHFEVAKDIKKIDLNENGYRAHIVREGKYMEKVFYGVRLIDFKKVFTVRSQYQLVNLTNFDYLVHFRFGDSSILKFLEKGEGLPLAMRLDDAKI